MHSAQPEFVCCLPDFTGEELIARLRWASLELQQVRWEVQEVVKTLREDASRGEALEALRTAIVDRLLPEIQRLSDTYAHYGDDLAITLSRNINREPERTC